MRVIAGGGGVMEGNTLIFILIVTFIFAFIVAFLDTYITFNAAVIVAFILAFIVTYIVVVLFVPVGAIQVGAGGQLRLGVAAEYGRSVVLSVDEGREAMGHG